MATLNKRVEEMTHIMVVKEQDLAMQEEWGMHFTGREPVYMVVVEEEGGEVRLVWMYQLLLTPLSLEVGVRLAQVSEQVPLSSRRHSCN